MLTTTHDELAVAVQRMRETWNKSSTITDPNGEYHQEWIDDLAVIADAYLAEHPVGQPSEEKLSHVESINTKLLAACEQTLLRYVEMFMALQLGDANQSVAVQLMRDAIDAAHAQTEDDAKLVDEEWLLSVGFSYEIVDGVKWLVQEPLTLGWFRGEGNLNWYFDGFLGPETVTRGDVRRLLTVLGIK